jgi:hypothetical protein
MPDHAQGALQAGMLGWPDEKQRRHEEKRQVKGTRIEK